jgi:hypothetical protein
MISARCVTYLTIVIIVGCKCNPPEEDKGSAHNREILDLITEIKNGDTAQTFKAVNELSRYSKRVVPYLIEMLDDKDARVRRKAAVCLGQVYYDAKSAVPKLMECLYDESGSVIMFAASALAKIDKQSNTVIEAIEAALKSDRSDVRSGAAFSLLLFGPNLMKIYDSVLVALTDSQPGVRKSVILALMGLERQAATAAPKLTKIMHEKKEVLEIRIMAARALIRIGGKTAETRNRLNLLKEEKRRAKESAAGPRPISSHTVEEVIKIANAEAVSKGIDLSKYEEPEAEFEVVGKEWKWTVSYEGKVKAPGNHFLVWVEDSDGSAEYMAGE